MLTSPHRDRRAYGRAQSRLRVDSEVAPGCPVAEGFYPRYAPR